MKVMMRILFALVITALVFDAPLAHARSDKAVVQSCEATKDFFSLDSIGNLVDPVRPFANGEIRVAHISTEEPAAASEHLLIFIRSKEGNGIDCFAVSPPSESGRLGFYALDFAQLRASYSEDKGLLLRIPARVNDGGEGRPVGDIKVRINRQYDNSVTIEGGY
jgi:hypothetical protein